MMKGMRAPARRLAEEIESTVPRWLRWVYRHAGAWLYTMCNGHAYREDIRAWAEVTGRNVSEVMAANMQYEMSHLAEAITPLGCTAGVREVAGVPVHVRCLDWPLQNIGRATYLDQGRDGRYYSVGIAGMVGALSGMVPGKFSLSINWAPPATWPRFHTSPLVLARRVLEECASYTAAKRTLVRTPVSCSVFFMLCGTRPGQACVIERTPKEAAVRKMRGGVLTVANHHETGRFMPRNAAFHEEDREYSRLRAEKLRKRLLARSTRVEKALETEDVWNEDTHQQMLFCPKTSTVKLWTI